MTDEKREPRKFWIEWDESLGVWLGYENLPVEARLSDSLPVIELREGDVLLRKDEVDDLRDFLVCRGGSDHDCLAVIDAASKRSGQGGR